MFGDGRRRKEEGGLGDEKWRGIYSRGRGVKEG